MLHTQKEKQQFPQQSGTRLTLNFTVFNLKPFSWEQRLEFWLFSDIKAMKMTEQSESHPSEAFFAWLNKENYSCGTESNHRSVVSATLN